MSAYKNLLLPTDLTKASEPAAVKARALADLTGATLTVLHLVDYVPPGYVAVQLPEEYSSEAALVDTARSHLAGWVQKMELGDCQQVVKAGSPKRIIIEVAAELGADLIVMGTHGDRGLARVIGSTASGVLHNAECDVLVVHL